MPSEAAQASITSGSTATTATRLEFKLSPKNKLSSQHWLAGEFDIQNNFHFLTIYETLRNKFALGIYILNLLWCYVLTLCQLKYVLFPVMSWQQKFNKIIQISDFIQLSYFNKMISSQKTPKKRNYFSDGLNLLQWDGQRQSSIIYPRVTLYLPKNYLIHHRAGLGDTFSYLTVCIYSPVTTYRIYRGKLAYYWCQKKKQS